MFYIIAKSIKNITTIILKIINKKNKIITNNLNIKPSFKY